MNIHELDSYRLSDAIKFNDQLNPRIWGEDENLLPDVRDHLLAIADDFREFLGLSDIELKDITISGSNAAYTYTPHSDIDLHLVVDLPQADLSEVYRELFDAKKYQYNDQHNFKIGGYDVELYVQNANEPPVSQGEYSVLHDKWLQVPKRQRANVDDMSTRSKYEDLGNRIESAIADGDRERMELLAKKIREMRTAGLASTGEFGPENLAFKLLRANGLIDKLRQARLSAKDQELSLKEQEKNKPKKIYGYKNYWFPGYEYYAQLSQEVDQPSEIEESVVNFKNGRKESLEKIVEKFTKFVCKHLHIKTVPTIKLIGNAKFGQAQQTMGHYVDDSRLIEVQTAGRHVLDILRTLAHELVHYSQHEKEDVPHTAGDTGSPWENEAHAVAGVLMRYFNRRHPEYFETTINNDVDEGLKGKLGALATAACIAGSPGCATTQGSSASDTIRDIQTVGRTAQTVKQMGTAGAKEELMQRLKNELRRQRGQVPEDFDPNGPPPGPETKPTMPAGTVRVDVSDVYDWYKLGQHISNLKGLGQHDFGSGPPSSIISFGDEETEHKYIKDLEKTGLSTTDIDPKDPKQPPGMKRQKVDPTYNVNEAFDQPYKLRWEKGDHGDIDAIAKLSDGNYLSIMFNKETNEDNEEAWSVEFFRNNSQEVTGEGDAQRVFATVLGAIQTFIKKYKPNRIIFSASKEVEQGQNAQSRARLYDSLVQRYARAWGFRAFRADTGNKVIYELNRIKPVVAEASGYIPVNSKEAQDPRYSMAVTVDIKPGEPQRQARKMGWSTNAAGVPPTLKTSGKI